MHTMIDMFRHDSQDINYLYHSKGLHALGAKLINLPNVEEHANEISMNERILKS
jgi:hypothetical protein